MITDYGISMGIQPMFLSKPLTIWNLLAGADKERPGWALIILRNGTESVVALFYGTERNTANIVNFHKSNLML